MKKNLSLCLVQSNIFWKNVNKNLNQFEKLISKVSKTDVILLPEMFNTAFCPKSNILSEKMDGETVSWMKKISRQKNCSIAGTLMVSENQKIYNRLVWVSSNGKIHTYDKYHLFSLVNEEKYISKGNGRLIIEEQGWKICPLICYDLRFPVFSRNNVEYDLLIYLANWPIKRIDAWDTLLKARSIENQCYTVGVNRIGKDENKVSFNGRSKVFDVFGKELISGEDNKEQVINIYLSLKDLNLKRRQMNFLKDIDSFTLE